MFDELRSAFQRSNNGHVQLIIINGVVFVLLALLFVFSKYGGFVNVFEAIHNQFMTPARFSEFATRPWTVVTYAFAHDLSSIWHILFNMVALYWFGRLFVEYLGSDKLIALYVLGAMAGAIAFLLAYNTIPYYMAHSEKVRIGLVGASAAVDAIVIAAATLLPNYTFFLLFIGPVKIKYIAAVTVFLSFIGTVGTNEGGNIAHLGGALIGFIYIKQLQAGINWGSWITILLDWFRDLFRSKPRVKVSYRNEATTPPPSRKARVAKASQDEIDAILDKISERGYESLSKEEKEKLFNASKKN